MGLILSIAAPKETISQSEVAGEIAFHINSCLFL